MLFPPSVAVGLCSLPWAAVGSSKAWSKPEAPACTICDFYCWQKRGRQFSVPVFHPAKPLKNERTLYHQCCSKPFSWSLHISITPFPKYVWVVWKIWLNLKFKDWLKTAWLKVSVSSRPWWSLSHGVVCSGCLLYADLLHGRLWGAWMSRRRYFISSFNVMKVGQKGWPICTL